MSSAAVHRSRARLAQVCRWYVSFFRVAKKRFGGGVVPADTGPPQPPADAVPGGERVELSRRVLRAAVGGKDRVDVDVAGVEGQSATGKGRAPLTTIWVRSAPSAVAAEVRPRG